MQVLARYIHYSFANTKYFRNRTSQRSYGWRQEKLWEPLRTSLRSLEFE
ncbi:hypothetical protein METESE_11470 [Mesoterricola sediminis]|uniref:Uncharacterized protein n=1 Tax=Mesoterricola sediminis TaxID=2927980 RepID=A0AA48KBK0_9BACT|nr:hypothetical protein METESE_11470 [Mesoterricola sediminis]